MEERKAQPEEEEATGGAGAGAGAGFLIEAAAIAARSLLDTYLPFTS